MVSGSLTYASYIEGVEFEQIDIPSTSPDILRVEVSSNVQGEVTIVVHVQDVADPAEAQALGMREATHAVNILAVEQGMFVRDAAYKSHSLKDTSSLVHLMANTVGMSTSGYCVKKLGGTSLASLKAALSDPTPPGEADYQLLRTTLASKDVASKFLALYRMLARLADPTGKDRQEEVDKLIVKHEPTVARPNSPHTNKPETTYTRLRNEYMHRSGVPITQVRAEMEAHLSGLIAVVQKALKSP